MDIENLIDYTVLPSDYISDAIVPNKRDRDIINKVMLDLNLDYCVKEGKGYIMCDLSLFDEDIKYINDIDFYLYYGEIRFYQDKDKEYEILINYWFGDNNGGFKSCSIIIRLDCSYYSYEESVRNIIKNIKNFVVHVK